MSGAISASERPALPFFIDPALLKANSLQNLQQPVFGNVILSSEDGQVQGEFGRPGYPGHGSGPSGEMNALISTSNQEIGVPASSFLSVLPGFEDPSTDLSNTWNKWESSTSQRPDYFAFSSTNSVVDILEQQLHTAERSAPNVYSNYKAAVHVAQRIKSQVDVWLSEKVSMPEYGLTKQHSRSNTLLDRPKYAIHDDLDTSPKTPRMDNDVSGTSRSIKRTADIISNTVQPGTLQAQNFIRTRDKTLATTVSEVELLGCTVCAKTSKHAYEWKRHEAKHYPSWTCMPNGTHIIDGSCAICGVADTSAAHRDTHQKLDACLAKSLFKRSFRGRDKLLEHLRIHLTSQDKVNLSEDFKLRQKALVCVWECDVALSPEALCCGFCNTYRPNWIERQEHILQHLKDGYTTSQWQLTG